MKINYYFSYFLIDVLYYPENILVEQFFDRLIYIENPFYRRIFKYFPPKVLSFLLAAKEKDFLYKERDFGRLKESHTFDI